MIQINQIKLNIDNDFEKIIKKIVSILKISSNKIELKDIKILRKSIDTRNKKNILYVYNVAIDLKDVQYEKKIINKLKNKNVILYTDYDFNPIVSNIKTNKQVVVVGSGPAGLFASYLLTLNGYKPIVLEQGEKVEDRINTVKNFSLNNVLNTNSNVSFGEGGAGTFSDGKLYTRTDTKENINKFILKTLIKFGANEKIFYDYAPHIGTDILSNVIINMRNEIVKLGGEFVYNYKWKVNDIKYGINSNNKIILAIGNSSRETFIDLYNNGFNIKPKDFAIGYRVIHKADIINKSTYGEDYINIAKKNGNASYHLKYHNDKYNKTLYSFCMCPGGFVINSSNSDNYLSINGMSYSKRDNLYSNSAIVININKDDFLISDNPLCGVFLQEKIENLSYKIGNGNIPYCRFEDFIDRNDKIANVENADKMFYNKSTYSKQVVNIFDDMFQFFNFNELFIDAMNYFNTVIDGFSDKNTIIAAVESRTSSPIKIDRNFNYECNIKNVYPCGEGLGHGGGIVSSAIDGVKVAINIIKQM